MSLTSSRVTDSRQRTNTDASGMRIAPDRRLRTWRFTERPMIKVLPSQGPAGANIFARPRLRPLAPMPSRCAEHVAGCRCCLAGIGQQGVVDDVGEPPFESPERFGFGVAVGASAFQVCACCGVVVRLGDGDAVDGGVELPVPDPAEPVPWAAGPDRQWRGAVVAGVGVP